MRIVIFGLSITSSWGNGHATTFRALTQALAARGHKILFFEKDTEWYASNRDLPEPPYCRVRLFRTWDDVLPQARRALYNCDVAMVGSYFPDGVRALDEMLRSTAAVKTFYDIDTPITIETLRRRGRADYLLTEQIPELDLYFSFTGGPMLREIESRFGAVRIPFDRVAVGDHGRVVFVWVISPAGQGGHPQAAQALQRLDEGCLGLDDTRRCGRGNDGEQLHRKFLQFD